MPRPPRVLVVHNRYRIEGGEERSVELQLRALGRAGVPHRLLERRSADTGRGRAAAARLFCAIGVAARDGGPCFRCRGRLTLPGFVLNCRESVGEAAAYAAALSLY